MPVLNDFDFLERNETATDHFFQVGKKCIQLFFAVDDLDHDRQIHRETKNFRGVNAAGRAETHRPAQHGRAGEMPLARFEHDRFVKRLMFPPVAFADEDPQQHRVFWDLHGVLFVDQRCAEMSEPDGDQTESE